MKGNHVGYHKNGLLIVFCCFFFLLCSVTGQEGQVRKGDNSVNRWGEPVEGCALSLSAPEKLAASEAVMGTVVFRNGSQVAVKFAHLSKWFEYEYRVTSGDGRETKLTLFGEQEKRSLQAGGASSFEEIAPGGQLVFKVELSRLYDMSLADEYKIQAFKSFPDKTGTAALKLASNVIKIKITDSN